VNTWTKKLCGAALGATALVLAACSGSEPSPQTLGPNRAELILFQDEEKDIQPYLTRVIVTDDFMRIDDGHDGSDFVLFDRNKQVVFNVVHGDQSILVVRAKPVTVKSPLKLTLDAHRMDYPDAPSIGGKSPVQYDLFVNGKVCTHVVAVPGLLEPAVAAMREFRRTLSGQHAENLPKTPVDMLDPCFLADDVFHPGRVLQYGFPLRQWAANGKKRSLMDFKTDFKADPKLFVLPEGYKHEEIGKMGISGTT